MMTIISYLLTISLFIYIASKLFMKYITVYTDENVSMKNKVVIITGCNTGIGLYTAKVMAKNGAHVIMAVRSRERGEKALNDIKSQYPNAQLTLLLLDLSDLSSVNEFVRKFNELNLPLHVLINNAGMVALSSSQGNEGIEQMFATNHLGHYLLTQKLLPNLIKSNTEQDPGRIVIVGSRAHAAVQASRLHPDSVERFTKLPVMKTSSLLIANTMNQYGFSKLCNLYHAQHLAQTFKQQGIKNVVVNSLHPGAIKSDLNRELGSLPWYLRILVTPLLIVAEALFFKDTRAGSQTTIYAASAPEMSHISGQYLDDLKPTTPSALARDSEVRQSVIDVSDKLIQPFV